MSGGVELIKPDFIIIGAMKSATSSLQEQLSVLPGVFMTTPKEPNFFSNDEIYAQGENWYSSLFDPASECDIKGEASTHYTKLPKYPETIDRLKNYCPQTKLIYVMRHPVDRLVSHFVHNWTMGFIPRDADINRLVHEYQPFISYSLYRMQLNAWFAEFGQAQILPVFFDRLMAQPQSELERICRFIGYKEAVSWKDDIGASNVSSQRLRKVPILSDINDSAFVSWVRRSFIPQSLRDAVKQRMRMKQRPKLSDAKRAELEKVFDKDLNGLGELFGVDLNCQNFKEVTANQSLEWRRA